MLSSPFVTIITSFNWQIKETMAGESWNNHDISRVYNKEESSQIYFAGICPAMGSIGGVSMLQYRQPIRI